MENYIFHSYLKNCRNVIEATSSLEIFNYSDPAYNSYEEHSLTSDELEDFLNRRGAFAPPKLKGDVMLNGGIRLVIQKDAKHPATFTPHVISLSAEEYESMVRTLHLPFRAIEGTSVVGPFFWSAYHRDDDGLHLQIIFRKSDVRKKGKTQGWELMLSHSFATGLTAGFAKGTESSDIMEWMRYLRASAAQVAHPLLLPVIILSHDLSSKNDLKQRETRDWLRRLEHAVSMHDKVEHDGYIGEGVVDLVDINRDLVECHTQVLWKRPKVYLKVIRGIKTAMARYWNQLPVNRRTGDVDKMHKNMLNRLEFNKVKLKGIHNYAHTTLDRLNIQRSALYIIMAEREYRLSLHVVGEQRRVAHTRKHERPVIKRLSLLGAIFLPGIYLSTLFSTRFFNFRTGSPNQKGDSPVSPQLWIYFAVTVLLTAIIVGSWWYWNRKRETQFTEEDVGPKMEEGIIDGPFLPRRA